MTHSIIKDSKKELPKNWKWVRLGEVCTFINGDAYKESDWSQEGIPIIRIQNLNNADKPFNYWIGDLKDRVRVKNGDLLLAWSGTPGTSFGAHIWTRGSGVLNQHIFLVYTDETLEKTWAKYAINHVLEDLIRASHGAVGLSHVTKREVESLQIPLPTLSEQKRIAAILNEQMAVVEKSRKAAEVRLSAVKALPSAYLRAVFPAKDQPLPKGWKLVKLGEVCKIFGGSQPPKGTFRYEPGEDYVRLVQIQDFRRSDMVVYIHKDNARRVFTEQDVMIGRYGPPVFQILRGLSGAYNVALMKTVPSADILRDYLYYLLKSPGIQYDVISQSQRAAGQTGVQKEYLEKYPVPLPPVPEQKRISTILNNQMAAVEKARKSAEAELEAIRRLPAALLRRAFNGEL